MSSESGVGEKKNSVDLVTEYDVRVEELVQAELKAQFPGLFFVSLTRSYLISALILRESIGEESYAAGSRPPITDAPTFCVDPIG